MADQVENDDKPCKFLELPECVLSILFSYLDTNSLYCLSGIHPYFQFIIESSPNLWKYIDARPEPNTDEKLNFCTNRIHEKTTHVLFRGRDRKCGQVPPKFLGIINPFQNIRVLALENQKFSNKRVLILDECKWITCNFLMSVAKYEKLEIVSVVKCLRIHLDIVPYLSVARFGFKNLKIFDCRFSGLGHELLRTFYIKDSLQTLYFQGIKSAELDYGEIISDKTYLEKVKYPYPDEFVGYTTIYDESLYEYVNTIAPDFIEPMPGSSMLYKDPYPECTCNYKEKVEDINMNSEPESDSDSADSDTDLNCCMYGMGRKMILLAPRQNHELRQEILEIRNNAMRDNSNVNQPATSVGSPPVADPHREEGNSNRPGTSRNFHDESNRRRYKRRRSDSDPGPDVSPPKKMKVEDTNEPDELDVEEHAARVNGLSETVTEMNNRVNECLQKGLLALQHPPVNPNRPGPSRYQEGQLYGVNFGTSQPETVSTANAKPFSPESPKDNPSSEEEASTSRVSPQRLQNLREDSSFRVISPPTEESPRNENSPPLNENNLVCLEPRRQPAVINLRNRHLRRFINPLYERDENAPKKKLQLHRLSLRGSKRITDAALHYIKNLNIDLLDLTYTSVTKRGIQYFLNSNPNCRIIHPSYCVCKPNNPFE
ncbi:hypothetical protein NQ317_005784 [Molorchus minor]|uniref:F-box domain-containing protein n=1 Tax=Molorchus minor TaxID=1323400 RepID=A0ABQ9JEK3_9CUCU|nr:hypothetical protein NQ317_005784 [Molorchus minor]